MRFVLSLMAGLILLGAVPVAAAEAAPTHLSASSVVTASKPGPAKFGAGPASATKLDGRPYFTYDASPGGVIEDDHIAIINYATKPLTLNVYTVDAKTGTNGLFAYAPKSAARKQVGAWLSVRNKTSLQVTVPGRTTIILPFSLHVPRNASPGDHAGAVIVSVSGLAQSKQQKVKLEQRIATRVIIRVSGPLHPQLSIENLHATYSGHLDPFASGTVTVTYTVHNTGNALLGGSQQVSAHGLFGSAALAKGVPSVPLLLPGGSFNVKTRVPGVAPEVWVTATVKLSPVGLRGDINPGLHEISASVTVITIPWILAAVVIIVLIVIILLSWRRILRIVRSRKSARASAKPTPQGVKS